MDEISPDFLFEAAFAYHLTAAVKAAVDLDLFTAIARGADTQAELAAATGAAERGARILADYLTVRGFLEKQDGRWRLTPSSAVFLDRRSPAFAGSIFEFMVAPEMVELAMANPDGTVREGGAHGLANIAPENPVWVKFAHAMAPFAAPMADLVAAELAKWPVPPRTVLDIAAGHGLYGVAAAKAVPGASVTAVDWPNVLEVARETAARAGVAARYRLCPGSAFEVDWGGDYDAVLVPNFLHHFDPPTCVGLLRKVRGSLSDRGRVFAVEFVPNEDRVSPPRTAAFSMVMLLTTPRGDAYTVAEFEAMAKDAGYAGAKSSPLLPTPQTLVEFLR